MMKKLVARTAQAALIATAFVPAAFAPLSPAIAASPAQDYCEDVLGGSYSKDGGQITCTVTSSETTGANGHGQTITTTIYYYDNGTWNNEPQSDSASGPCNGPGNSGDSSAHCN
jgi:hypothetical protein